MTHDDDFDDVIAGEIPDDVVEELIRGAFEAGRPAELLGVGRVLRAAHRPIPGEDRAREAEVVEAMLAAMTVAPIVAARSAKGRRRHVLVAVTAAVSVLGISGVAAAAGSLPTPIQSFVHESLSHVGVSVPSTDDAPAPSEPEAPDNVGVSPEPNQSGDAPTQSGDAPDQSGNAPTQSNDAQDEPGSSPGRSGSAPGQSGATPGQSGNAPGQSDDEPGQSEKKSNNADKKSDRSDNARGQSNK